MLRGAYPITGTRKLAVRHMLSHAPLHGSYAGNSHMLGALFSVCLPANNRLVQVAQLTTDDHMPQQENLGRICANYQQPHTNWHNIRSSSMRLKSDVQGHSTMGHMQAILTCLEHLLVPIFHPTIGWCRWPDSLAILTCMTQKPDDNLCGLATASK
ncbi:hypothetical protein O181_026270 [Austropuccinia psidii MF-1]|uniref:Uncharacterized protein n=1 Tax=Austropuccinia psidii MF-1 TaxID=1389203 RepID=A0A9Q3CP30_9BASI|nr:hypothetical protein [Austropuccinia psidii MF-1]